ncbi:MAG: MFS transporter [Acetobacteraceae bacterium]|nr:MFS transporter [Acetobacteraceae bacterium]
MSSARAIHEAGEGNAIGRSADASVRKRSLRGLDWLNFLVAAMQMGFGPFLSVYLTAHFWNPEQIGLAFSIGTAVVLVAQVPAGALVDVSPSKAAAALIAILAIAVAAIIIALVPVLPVVLVALALQSAASCALTPAIASITLALTHQDGLGERLGYNMRFAAIGAGAAAALMGAVGYWLSPRAVFFLAAGAGLAALAALRAIHADDIFEAPSRTDHISAVPHHKRTESQQQILRFCHDQRLLVCAAGMVLFQLANAAVLPLAANAVTRSQGRLADLFVTAAIIVPQALTALLSPRLGRLAESWGRRPVMLIGTAAVPIRAALLAINGSPVALVCFQVLDGITASVMGLMVPLIVADITRRTGRFNLGMGILGLASGLGATLSNAIGGAIANTFGQAAAFAMLGVVGVVLVGLVWREMPDTKRKISAAAKEGTQPPARGELRVGGR